MLERRLRLQKRWWEAAGDPTDEQNPGLMSSPPGGHVDDTSAANAAAFSDDDEIVAMDKSSTGVIEVYVITPGAAGKASLAAAAVDSLGAQGHRSVDEHSDSSEEEFALFS